MTKKITWEKKEWVELNRISHKEPKEPVVQELHRFVPEGKAYPILTIAVNFHFGYLDLWSFSHQLEIDPGSYGAISYSIPLPFTEVALEPLYVALKTYKERSTQNMSKSIEWDGGLWVSKHREIRPGSIIVCTHIFERVAKPYPIITFEVNVFSDGIWNIRKYREDEAGHIFAMGDRIPIQFTEIILELLYDAIKLYKERK